MSGRVLVKFEMTISAKSKDEALRHAAVVQAMLMDYPAGLEESEGEVMVLVGENQTQTLGEKKE